MHRCDCDQTSEPAVTIMNRLHRGSEERTCRTCSFTTVPKMAPFFLKFFMVELGRVLNDVWYHIGSSVGARHPIHVSCAWVIVCSLLFPHFVLFRVFLLSLLLLLEPGLVRLPCGRLHHCFYWSEKKMHNEHKLITQDEKASWQVLLEISKFQGNLMRCFHATVNRVRTRFPKETEVTNRETVSRVHSVFNFADPASVGKSLLDGNKDHLFDQASSELLKQNHQVLSLNNCIDELQQHAYAQRLELQDAHHRYIESRREQSRLQEEEELSMKEKSLRETQIRTRDGRNEESWRTASRRILCIKIERKSWDNTKAHVINAGNAWTDEFYEWFRWISRSGIESQWEIVLHSQSTSSDSKISFYAELRQTLATWHMEYVWTTGTRFWKSIFYIWFVPKSLSRNWVSSHSFRLFIHSLISGVKVSQSEFLIYASLHHLFLNIGRWYLLMNFHVVQFKYGFELFW